MSNTDIRLHHISRKLLKAKSVHCHNLIIITNYYQPYFSLLLLTFIIFVIKLMAIIGRAARCDASFQNTIKMTT